MFLFPLTVHLTSMRTPRCEACAPFLPAVPHHKSYRRDPSVLVGAYDRIAKADMYDKEDGNRNEIKSVALIGEACLCVDPEFSTACKLHINVQSC